MPFVGRIVYTNASHDSKAEDGNYWSSSLDGSDAYSLLINSSDVYTSGSYARPFGYSVRLFLDEYIEPDNIRTVEA